MPGQTTCMETLTDFALCKEITKDMDFVFHVAGIKGSIDVTVKKPASFFVPLLIVQYEYAGGQPPQQSTEARLHKLHRRLCTAELFKKATASGRYRHGHVPLGCGQTHGGIAGKGIQISTA